MKKQLKSLAIACAAAATLGAPALSHAYPAGFSSINFRPAISNKTDYFGVYSSQTIAKQGWNAGFYLDYAKNPLEFGQPAGTRVEGVVDHQLVGNHYATYGILDWLSFGINIPVVWWEKNRTLLTSGPAATFTPDFNNNIALSDIRLEMKFRLRNNEDRLVGIALIPFVLIPSGDSFEWAGTGSVAGGLKFVLDFNISERVNLALNLGYRMQQAVDILNVEFDDQILGGLGLSVKIIEKLSFIAEAASEPIIKNLFNTVQTPFELRGGFRVHLNDNFDINVGGGAGLTIGIGSPDYRAFLGLNYNWVPPACECPEPPAERQIVIDQVIHFAFDKAVIKEVSYPILNDVAAIIKSNEGSISNITVEGNTDSIGSDAYNQKLSDRRAAAVKEYLVQQGVPASKLTTVGYGESQPVATNETAEGRAQNRRVEFKVDLST